MAGKRIRIAQVTQCLLCSAPLFSGSPTEALLRIVKHRSAAGFNLRSFQGKLQPIGMDHIGNQGQDKDGPLPRNEFGGLCMKAHILFLVVSLAYYFLQILRPLLQWYLHSTLWDIKRARVMSLTNRIIHLTGHKHRYRNLSVSFRQIAVVLCTQSHCKQPLLNLKTS